ncbi:Integrase catalytic domain-containing protein [Citrus sinensis]|nr:Integrase catalytic domain-containing protein [Citrus sinensis]
MEQINVLEQQLREVFEMKDLRAAKKILGVEIIRDKKQGILYLTQQKCIRKVLEKFGMGSSKPVQTPLPAHFRLSSQQCPKTEEEMTEINMVPYSSVVGCLMYAMVLTRPDISYAVSVVSKYMANPGQEHWKVVIWVLRYLKGTSDYDADFAGDLDKKRSSTGYIFTLNGCTVNWKATLKNVVALSIIEAEYTAAAEAVKESIWLRGMVTELGFKQEQVLVHCDNHSAICLSKNQVHHERTKHIDIKLHFLRLEVSKGVVKLEKIHTDDNLVDFLTKAVPGAKFELCLNSAGICKI